MAPGVGGCEKLVLKEQRKTFLLQN